MHNEGTACCGVQHSTLGGAVGRVFHGAGHATTAAASASLPTSPPDSWQAQLRAVDTPYDCLAKIDAALQVGGNRCRVPGGRVGKGQAWLRVLHLSCPAHC